MIEERETKIGKLVRVNKTVAVNVLYAVIMVYVIPIAIVTLIAGFILEVVPEAISKATNTFNKIINK